MSETNENVLGKRMLWGQVCFLEQWFSVLDAGKSPRGLLFKALAPLGA